MSKSEVFFRLYLVSSAGGKTTVCSKMRGETDAPWFDVDDARVASIDPLLKLTRRMRLWSIHNVSWHAMVAGAVFARGRASKAFAADGPIHLNVCDHTGWFVEDLRLWDSVVSVTVVTPASVRVRARRFVARGGSSNLTLPEAEAMLRSQDLARGALLTRVPRQTKVTSMSEADFWRIGDAQGGVA